MATKLKSTQSQKHALGERVLAHQPHAEVAIPPNTTPDLSVTSVTLRDYYTKVIAETGGGITWQHESSHSLRSYVELAMRRYMRIFGKMMKAPSLPQQKPGRMNWCVYTEQYEQSRDADRRKNLKVTHES